ncbi:lipoprotein insertase outer membrane protein LolB [Ramlibacter sp. AN1015]|uniref:lipoprotein insertase outer membrane protein LolB n=1 Tax=Ramlibacter sp. AN1015 TaxID=3133428 RepID=UPI0030C0F952
MMRFGSPASCVRLGRRSAALAVLAALAGCAPLPRTSRYEESAVPRWSGRLALQVQADPPQAFSAAFDLRGSVERGELALFTPLGNTAAVLSWAPGLAVLREEGRPPQGFASLEAVVSHALGASVPIEALFDWLRGVDTRVAGWEADLSGRERGRLLARRREPGPSAQLRIVLDTP